MDTPPAYAGTLPKYSAGFPFASSFAEGFGGFFSAFGSWLFPQRTVIPMHPPVIPGYQPGDNYGAFVPEHTGAYIILQRTGNAYVPKAIPAEAVSQRANFRGSPGHNVKAVTEQVTGNFARSLQAGRNMFGLGPDRRLTQIIEQQRTVPALTASTGAPVGRHW